MSPWIEASRSSAANRWLDESSVALRGEPLLSSANVLAELSRTLHPQVHGIDGRASVSASLAIHHPLHSSSQGVTLVSAQLGWLRQIEAGSSGVATVTGELIVGQVEHLSGVSSGRTTVRSAWLTWDRDSYVSGERADDDWNIHDPVPTSRGNGRARGRFSPRSVGSVNTREAWRGPANRQ